MKYSPKLPKHSMLLSTPNDKNKACLFSELGLGVNVNIQNVQPTSHVQSDVDMQLCVLDN